MASKSPRFPLRIAVLECDRPLPRTAERYGGYTAIHQRVLEASAEALKDELPGIEAGLAFTAWNVYQAEEYPNLEDIDAILLTGAQFTAFDDEPWIIKLVGFVKKVLAQDRVRTMGVCFGHQIIGRALGIPVVRGELGWEISVVPITLTPTGQSLFKNRHQSDTLSLMHMHRDILKTDIVQLPDGCENLGSTNECSIQGMYKEGRYFSVQGHPEYTPDIVRESIEAKSKLGLFTEDVASDGLRRHENTHDGIAVGMAFLRFLMK